LGELSQPDEIETISSSGKELSKYLKSALNQPHGEKSKRSRAEFFHELATDYGDLYGDTFVSPRNMLALGYVLFREDSQFMKERDPLSNAHMERIAFGLDMYEFLSHDPVRNRTNEHALKPHSTILMDIGLSIYIYIGTTHTACTITMHYTTSTQ
jgi:hypothetical protein